VIVVASGWRRKPRTASRGAPVNPTAPNMLAARDGTANNAAKRDGAIGSDVRKVGANGTNAANNGVADNAAPAQNNP
jgi:hypothetical protein